MFKEFRQNGIELFHIYSKNDNQNVVLAIVYEVELRFSVKKEKSYKEIPQGNQKTDFQSEPNFDNIKPYVTHRTFEDCKIRTARADTVIFGLI